MVEHLVNDQTSLLTCVLQNNQTGPEQENWDLIYADNTRKKIYLMEKRDGLFCERDI